MPVDATDFNALAAQVDSLWYRDRARLRRQLKKLTQQADPEALAAFERALQTSLAALARRHQAVPEIGLVEDLPIARKRQAIAEALAQHPLIVVAGETGSGKTTQLPKICLSLGRGVRAMIGHTQPRRIAARSVASRIAEELAQPLGELIGYQVRFADKLSDTTAVKLMTDGILLAEIQADPLLWRYDTLIIDEAHERSLTIDFLLGYVRQLLPKRPDLKVIITSATIDVEKFSRHFDHAPIISVSGRSYPVDVVYRPLRETGSDSQVAAIIAAIHDISCRDPRGDILVFLSGEAEIRETALQLRREQLAHTTVVPLYARLSIAEQNKIFQAHRGRRVVLATNVAETSLTVPGIRYVIDPGYARISRYSARAKIQRLPVEAISQASANQRKGRCGRVSDGLCIRLYSEADFNARPAFTEAEILRTNLAAVILQMAQLGLGDIRHFPFVDMPDERMINDGYKLLQTLQAMTANGRLTALGRRLASLPVDPRLGRILLAALEHHCVDDVAVIVSALSIQDPRERPADKQQAADQKHRDHWHEASDLMAYLSLWRTYETQRQALSKNALQRWCQRNFLSPNRLREWREVHTQIVRAMQPLRRANAAAQHPLPETDSARYEAIHRSLLAGLLDHIGHCAQDKSREYLGVRNRRFGIFPGSSQFKKRHVWIIAGQLLETSKLYAHAVAKIEPQWLVDAAGPLLKRHYSEPHYDKRSGQVMAYEKITLYGLVVTAKKRLAYGAIDPVVARELFIRSALVEGQYGEHRRVRAKLRDSQHFFVRQQQLLAQLQELEAKSRRRDILVDEQVLFDFYHQRIPDKVVNLDGFEHWRQQVEAEQPGYLSIPRSLLMQHQAGHITEAQFPNRLRINDNEFALIYHFDPGHLDDGVTLQVPVQLLHQVRAEPLTWLVPGLLREKCIAMLKALPKQWRKQLVPVPETVDRLLPALLEASATSAQALAPALARQLHRQVGVQLADDLLSSVELEHYYQMNIQVLDAAAKVIDRSRDLSVLRARYRDHVQSHLQAVGHSIERTGLTRWDFDDLPAEVDITRQGLSVRAYPALVDRGESVDIVLYDNPREALVDSLRAMVRLVMLTESQKVHYLRKHLVNQQQSLALAVVAMGTPKQLVDDIIAAAIKQTCFAPLFYARDNDAERLPRTAAAFAAQVASGSAQIIACAQSLAQQLLSALAPVAAIKQQLKRAKNPLVLASAAADIQQQLAHLFYPGCVYEIAAEQLSQYPRYVKAISLRLDKVPAQRQKDCMIIAELAPLWSLYQQMLQAQGPYCLHLYQDLRDYRWMLEELRVSLFAQTLGTQMPVSVKRLQKQWDKVKKLMVEY
ncbi:MAG: ATP-dependent RNA helicase HrpA [Cellvibrionaceae bacterium]|nr:ATP-dependent RNA helicase HrpA [Cellvibrionaceae bacterium]